MRLSALRSHPVEPKIKRAYARASDPAIERECDRAHASSAREVRVALAAIANLLRRGILERLHAIDLIPRDRSQCDRTQPLRSSVPDLAITLIFAYK